MRFWFFEIVLHETIYCFQRSWMFLKFSETLLKSKLLCAQSRWRAKYQTEMQSCIAKLSNSGQKVKLQVEFPAKKNTLTVDTDDRTFNCNNADGHSQTGNCKKLASRIQKTGWRTKATRSALRLYTPCVLNFHLHNVPVILDLTDKRKWIAFQVQPVNWWLLLFQLCKMQFEQF